MKNSLPCHRPVSTKRRTGLSSRIKHITTATCSYFLSFSVKICVICAGFFFLPFSSFSQNPKTDLSTIVLTKADSLLQVLKTTKQACPEPCIGDTNKVNTLNDLSWEFKDNGEYEKAKQYANDALSLSNSLPFGKGWGWAKGIAASYNNIGVIDMGQGNYPDALKNHFASLKIRDEIGDKKGIASSYNNIGMIYKKQGNYPDALKNYFASLKIKEELGDKKGIATSYNNIGTIYMEQDNYPDALKNYFASLKIRDEIGDKKGVAACYNNIGIIYYHQGNYPDALKNHFASLKIKKELEDKNGIAGSYNNIGIIYMEQGNYPDALKNYFASLKISEELGDKNGIAASYINLGSIKLKMANISKSSLNKGELHIQAKKYLDDALFLSKEIGMKEAIKESYSNLAALDSAQGKAALAKQLWQLGATHFGKSLEHYKMYIIYRDSIDNEETRKKTIQTSMTYEYEQKDAVAKAEQEKKDAVAAEEKQREKLIRYSVSGGLVLALVFAIFIFRGYKQKQKANIIITQQKEEVETQKKVVEEQKELVEEHIKEINDSINYAQRIQYSFLATTEMLDEHLSSPSGGGAEGGGGYFVFFAPKDVVSGDFYWAAELSNGKFALVTADSTGHGVPGAIMSILNISCLEHAVEVMGLLEPAEILNHTRTKIVERLKKDGSIEGGKDGMDCSLISFDFKNNKLTYSAANNPIWIVRGKEILEFKPDKMPLGKNDRDNILFTQHTIDLQKGDLVYATTDGMPDQFGGPTGKKFMYKQLKELLISIASLPMQEQKENLTNALNNWKGNLEQVDDVCVIGVRV